ncbi:hypothetical protein ACFYWP_36885 [Actinacidiphila glaucinigra]|uniref:hypothetical protein n=1 Tax=Actinacidiphila glaucinigra TaxID=235986 RepID=UPI0036D02DB5
MTTNRARKKQARALAAADGIPYSQALALLEQQPGGPVYVLQPTEEEIKDGITPEELGVKALGPDATPSQRAAAEAHWRPVYDPGQPCRCSGNCDHGKQCAESLPEGDDGGDQLRCTGRVVHTDRYPGSIFSVITWYDEYACTNAEECDGDYDREVSLPALPWGEAREGGGIVVYDRIRHPQFPDFDSDTPEHPPGNGSCLVCGDYALAGLLCDGHRAEGYDDRYGVISEPDPDDCRCGGGCEDCSPYGTPYGERGW